MLLLLVRFVAGLALAAAFSGRLLFGQLARLVGPEDGRDHLALAIAVKVVYAQARGGHENRGCQQVYRDISN